jgi:DNA-binding CsgD family transcriptional regulator
VKQFKGAIRGEKLTDFNNIDYNLDKLKDRIDCINSMLGDNNFFFTYFSKYFDVSPSQSGYLSEETSVCKVLEIMGTYIVSAKDVASERKIEYRFWRDEKDFKKSKESENVKASTSNGNGDVEIIDMFVDKKNNRNQKVVKPVGVTAKDIKSIKEIKDLENAIERLKSPKGMRDIKEHVAKLLELDISEEDRGKLKYIAKNTERYVNRYVKDLRDSQLLIKKAITRPVEFKNVLKDEGVPNKLDAIDFMEVNDIQILLPYMSQEDMMTEIGTIIYDLGELLKSTKLSAREQEIIVMFKNGYKQTEIAEELGIKKQNVKTYMKRISEKAVKTYEKQVESYRELIRQKKVK